MFLAFSKLQNKLEHDEKLYNTTFNNHYFYIHSALQIECLQFKDSLSLFCFLCWRALSNHFLSHSVGMMDALLMTEFGFSFSCSSIINDSLALIWEFEKKEAAEFVSRYI